MKTNKFVKTLKWKSFLIILLLTSANSSRIVAQDVYYTKKGQISFYSKAPLENIEAHNNEVVSFIDINKNEIAFSLLIKGFHFEKALMEEHFNTSYLESDKYPKATFKGKVTDAGNLKLDVDGDYPIKISGTLTIHNVSKEISSDAIVSIQDKKISGKANFKIRIADFEVKIPSVVSQNIAEVVEITVDCNYQPLEQ